MKTASLALCLILSAAPVLAQDTDESTKTEEGLSLLDQGARLLFEGLLQDLDPAIEDLKGLAADLEPRFQAMIAEMGPALLDLVDRVDDFANYDAPEILENGDIILRRKPDAPVYVPPIDPPAIDL